MKAVPLSPNVNYRNQIIRQSGAFGLSNRWIPPDCSDGKE